MATEKAPSPAASNQPTAPAYQPRGSGSWAAIQRMAASRGVPQTAGVGCSDAHQIEDVDRARERRGDGRPEVVDVAQGAHHRRGGDADAARQRLERGADGVDDHVVLAAILVALEQRGRGARVPLVPPRGRAGERVGLDREAALVDEALRRGAEEDGLAALEREAHALGVERAEPAERGRDVEAPRPPATLQSAMGTTFSSS